MKINLKNSERKSAYYLGLWSMNKRPDLKMKSYILNHPISTKVLSRTSSLKEREPLTKQNFHDGSTLHKNVSILFYFILFFAKVHQ